MTGVPSGKIICEKTFDMSPYIIGGKGDLDSDSMKDNEICDEEFVCTFTLL